MSEGAALQQGESIFTGKIHFRAGFSFVELAGMGSFPVLFEDPTHTATPTLLGLRQTAVALQQLHQENDLVSFTGILRHETVAGQGVNVLHFD